MKRPRLAFARARARLLLSHGQETEPPVNVKKLARLVGATVCLAEYDGELAGSVIRLPGKVIIGVNGADHLNRQRFTIAHELGHLLLHEGKQVHLDERLRVNLRSPTSSMAVDPDEMEANQFAAELLMPEAFLEQDMLALAGRDLESGGDIGELAKKYQVSEQAMTIRLVALRYLA